MRKLESCLGVATKEIHGLAHYSMDDLKLDHAVVITKKKQIIWESYLNVSRKIDPLISICAEMGDLYILDGDSNPDYNLKEYVVKIGRSGITIGSEYKKYYLYDGSDIIWSPLRKIGKIAYPHEIKIHGMNSFFASKYNDPIIAFYKYALYQINGHEGEYGEIDVEKFAIHPSTHNEFEVLYRQYFRNKHKFNPEYAESHAHTLIESSFPKPIGEHIPWLRKNCIYVQQEYLIKK